MKSKLIKTVILTMMSIVSISITAITPTASAVDACQELPKNSVAYDAAGCGSTSNDGLFNVIEAILYTVISVVSIVAVIFIIIGGVKYMTSAGDPSKASSARKTILYAAIGLVVCALAFAIVNFVIGGILKQ